MSDSPGGFKPKGALLECFLSFPQFQEDLVILVREGFLRVTSPETCEWLKSKTSLAEYFKWTGWDAEWVSGGFWAPIENTFGIKRHTLRKLAGNNANPLKPEQSRDFKKIKALVQKHRTREQIKLKEKRIFRYIKTLVLEMENEEPETIHTVLEKICTIFFNTVDKNRQNRR
jgi:hypothetical protein